MKIPESETPPAPVSLGLIFTLVFAAVALVVIGVCPELFIKLADSSAMWFF
jgi:NADH:ubiquinone oxidoreductase subunit 2 (subunit N)